MQSVGSKPGTSTNVSGSGSKANNTNANANSSSASTNAVAAREVARTSQFKQRLEKDLSDGQYVGKRGFPYPATRPTVFVKTGDGVMAEGKTQELAFQHMEKKRSDNPNLQIHVPEVFAMFSTEGGEEVVVMELVQDSKDMNRFIKDQKLDHAKAKACYEMVVDAIKLFREIPPVDDIPGPAPSAGGSRLVKNTMFYDEQADIPFKNIRDLQEHLNEALIHATVPPANPEPGPRVKPTSSSSSKPPSTTTHSTSAAQQPKVRRAKQYKPIVLEQKLTFCYTDLSQANFKFKTEDKGGGTGRDDASHVRLYVVDFELAAFLPASFLAFAIARAKERQLELYKHLQPAFASSSLDTSNVESMARVRRYLRSSSSSAFADGGATSSGSSTNSSSTASSSAATTRPSSPVAAGAGAAIHGTTAAATTSTTKPAAAVGLPVHPANGQGTTAKPPTVPAGPASASQGAVAAAKPSAAPSAGSGTHK
ncbi:hypothetical protein B0T26DRAFT_753701 [Lasiosphaeria miniovina]|uniref:Uncharacterized protein n=1 Tax=Lasiosphaeria miniovina TaxID=1954250 RepID=A0AA40ADD7_9PEZI|nr:uncharacterized protein B0T26DRAFT_753701 [Lasiosphaeria miniovina]KAK0713608.1 hypothetical protein B0T26DRAFT_753701 [Lasiosphaeria miniovina]